MEVNMKENNIHLNDPSVLPPIDTPLLIEYNGKLVRAYRESFIKRKSDALVYILNASSPDIEGRGAKIEGRYKWTFA